MPRALVASVLALFVASGMTACPQKAVHKVSVPGIQQDEARYRPSDSYLAEQSGRVTHYQPGSLQVVAATFDPKLGARISLVAYLNSDGDYCVDLIPEKTKGRSGGRKGLCTARPVRDSFNFTDGQLMVGGAALGFAMGLARGSVVQLRGKRFNATMRGRVVPGMLSASLPQFGGLVAWAVVVDGWSPSGGDVITVEGFSTDGKKVLNQDVCNCS